MATKYFQSIICLLIFLILALFSCPAPESGDKGLGFVAPPAMLYKSFRAVSPQANTGAAPDPAGDVDLSPYFPEPGDQGEIGSCTAWTTAYACKSFHENLERSWDVDDAGHLFSPSFIYNQINGGRDQGAALESAITAVIENGCATLASMPYTEDYRRQPTAEAFAEAAAYKAKSFARVDHTNLVAVKAVLTGGNSVLIGMMLSENFYEYTGGVYRDTAGVSIGGHAMCVVGYDDSRSAFKIINSWGTYWGEQGYLWLDYELFKRDVVTALVMYDEVITRPETAAPPVDVEASRGAYGRQIKVVWQAAANAISYLVFRSTDPAAYFRLAGETLGTTYIDTSVAPGQVYYYALKSVSRTGESVFSESSGGYAGSLETEPGVPQRLQGIFSEGKAYLKWDSVSGAGGYYVYQFDNAAENFLRIGATGNPSFRHQDSFGEGEILWYVVTAYKGENEGQASGLLSLTAEIKVKKLNAPRKLQASRGTYADRIEISWREVKDATGYRFYKYYVGEEKWKFLTTLDTPAYVDTQPGTLEAYYIVTATRGDLVSGPSEPAWGWIREFKSGQVKKKYADEKYYDDGDYFEDEDYTDEKNYSDDRPVDEAEKNKTFEDFSDEVKREPGADKEAEKERKARERATDDKFLNAENDISTEAEVLDKVRESGGDKTKPKNNNKAAGLVKDEMTKDDSEFFEDDDDDFFEDDDDDFFEDDDDFF